MLFHPSALIEDHVAGARLIASWSNGSDQPSVDIGTEPTDENGWPVLSAEGLRARLRREPEAWQRCLEDFLQSWQHIGLLPGAGVPPGLGSITWNQVESVLDRE